MSNTNNLIAIVAALVITAAVVFFGLPFLMSFPFFAHTVDRYVLQAQNPLIPGVVLGLGFAVFGALAYFLYRLFRPPEQPRHVLELTDAP